MWCAPCHRSLLEKKKIDTKKRGEYCIALISAYEYKIAGNIFYVRVPVLRKIVVRGTMPERGRYIAGENKNKNRITGSPPTESRRKCSESTTYYEPTHPPCATAVQQCVGQQYKQYLRSRASAPFPGRERSVPGRATLHAPRSPSRASAAILSPGIPRADVWGGRGTVVVPRGVGWRSGLAAVFWVY